MVNAASAAVKPECACGYGGVRSVAARGLAPASVLVLRPRLVRHALIYMYTHTIIALRDALTGSGGRSMMPNKTIYVADSDLPLYEQAQAMAGGNLSAAIAQALRRF